MIATLKRQTDRELSGDLGALHPEEAAVLGLVHARLARG